MPIVTYNGDSFSCTKAVKGSDYIDLYDNDILIVKFGGVVDFSKFSISDGSWSAPAGVEEVRGTATLSNGLMSIAVDAEVGDNTLVKFRAPCACSSITAGVKIGNTTYTIVDASGNVMTGAGSGAWSEDAHVALLLSKSTGKAYIQNSAVSDAYTKQQSISDSVKSTLGLNAGAVPSDAFTRIAERLPKVGDTVRTYRTDLSDNWLRCDGSFFDPDEYPKLAAIMPSPAELCSAGLIRRHTMRGTVAAYVEANGYQVIAYKGSGIIEYSTDNFKTYNSVTVTTETGSSSSVCLRYANGYWIFAWQRTGSPYGSIKVKCCKDTPFGSWSSATTISSKGYSTIYDIWYANNLYYIATSASNETGDGKWGNDYAYVISSITPDFASAVPTQIVANEINAYGFVRDDKYCIWASAGCICWSTVSNPTFGTYKKITLEGMGSEAARSLTYCNGLHIMIVESGHMAYSSDITTSAPIVVDVGIPLGTAKVGYARGNYFAAYMIDNPYGDDEYGIAIGPDVTSSNGWAYIKRTNFYFDSYYNAPASTVCTGHVKMFGGTDMFEVPLYILPDATATAPMYEYMKARDGV